VRRPGVQSLVRLPWPQELTRRRLRRAGVRLTTRGCGGWDRKMRLRNACWRALASQHTLRELAGRPA
jgi:hypothetical protein